MDGLTSQNMSVDGQGITGKGTRKKVMLEFFLEIRSGNG